MFFWGHKSGSSHFRVALVHCCPLSLWYLDAEMIIAEIQISIQRSSSGLLTKQSYNWSFVQDKSNYVAVDSSNDGYGSCCPLGIHAAPSRDLFWGFEHNTEGNLIAQDFARITRLIKFWCRALFWRHRANEPDSAARGHGLPPMQDLWRGKLVSIVKMMTDDDMFLLMTEDYNIETPFSADTREKRL